MRTSFDALPASLLLVAAVALHAPCAMAQPAKVVVTLELAQQFYYEADSLPVQISVRNPSDQSQANPLRTPLLKGFKVRTADRRPLEAEGQATVKEPARPEELSPGSFYGAVVDIGELYPQLRRVGTYEIYWGADGVVSDMLVVTIIPRYDPGKDYLARIETDQGPIVMDFFRDKSPIAVKSFIDMANAGLYDGLQFHEVHADSFVGGGDPTLADPPRRAINFPFELSSVPLVTGTVVLRPVSAAPPANGSTFMIVLRPQPEWTGQVTVLGQVIKGLDVVRKISLVPASPRTARPAFKPLEPIKLRKVTIEERRPASPSPP